MAKEGFDDKKGTSDPDKDFGLPKIEIKPIPLAEVKPDSKEFTTSPGSKKELPSSGKSKATGRTTTENRQQEEKKGRSISWIILLVLLVSVFGGGWYYYSLKNYPTPEKIEQETMEETQAPTLSDPQPDPAIEPTVEEAETYSLTEIRSREDRPRYFVVVASFIDEDLAKDHAEKLHQKEMDTYLVYPYGEIAYYRLAIGQFDSFALAAEEINQVKEGFNENLWVLKY